MVVFKSLFYPQDRILNGKKSIHDVGVKVPAPIL